MTRLRYSILLIPALVIGWPVWVMNAHGVASRHLTSIRVGMTAADVTELLGNPDKAYPAAAGGESWVYDRGTWCMINLHFSANGVVVDWGHDH